MRDSAFTLSNGLPGSDLLSYDGLARRYLDEFSEIILIGRLFTREDPSATPVTGPGARFVALPGYHGPLGFLLSLPKILRVVWSTIDRDAAYILRVPATVPSIYSVVLWCLKVPYAVEVAADPYYSYSKQALGGHILAPVFRHLFSALVRWQCRGAIASAYVTREALQRRYPPRSAASSFSFTSIDLTPEAYVPSPRNSTSFNCACPHLVLVGNMQNTMKGHDVLLNAMKILKDRGVATRLTVVGFGDNLPRYATLADAFGLDVTFTGKLQNGGPVRQVLDSADLFVLPSRQEGLPRALLEAMARALPAIATRIGGTPELLDDDCLAPPDCPEALADAIFSKIGDSAELARLSARNLTVAKGYEADRVRQVRASFYRYVRDAYSRQGTRQ